MSTYSKMPLKDEFKFSLISCHHNINIHDIDIMTPVKKTCNS